MFKNRKFLIGLGVGLVISSLFLIFFTPPTQIEEQKNKEWTVEQLKEVASKKGYELLTIEEYKELKEQTSNVPPKVNNEEHKVQIDFIIAKGKSTSEIADYLVERKIISSEADFLNILEKYHLTTKIRAGEYTYLPEMTVKEIVAMITHTKQEEWEM